MSSPDTERLKQIIVGLNNDERRELFRLLRMEFPIHKLEQDLATTAEVILEAIARGTDLTIRGVRGLIAEAAFKTCIIEPLLANGWLEDQDAVRGDVPYDFVLTDRRQQRGRVQVKMQRLRDKRPLYAREIAKTLYRDNIDCWVVETQRTRGGKDSKGSPTRPYKFGEFDILSVALHPSTQDWSKFLHTVADWLIPDPSNPAQIFKYQPVSQTPNSDWTEDLETVFGWFREGRQKRISKD